MADTIPCHASLLQPYQLTMYSARKRKEKVHRQTQAKNEAEGYQLGIF